MKLIIRNLDNTKEKIREQFPIFTEETLQLLTKDLKESDKILFIGSYPLIRIIVAMMKKVGVEVVLNTDDHVARSNEIKLILDEEYKNQERRLRSERIKRGKAHE
jgi:hypothetical protein